MQDAPRPFQGLLMGYTFITVVMWIVAFVIGFGEGKATIFLLPAMLSLGWMWIATQIATELRRVTVAQSDCDRNRTAAISLLDDLLRAADDFAVQIRSGESPDRKNRHIQSARRLIVHKFVFTAAHVGVTPEELAALLDRPFFHLDPMILRDEVDDLTARDGWPRPDPAWKADLMTFVRLGSSWPVAEIVRFETSLRAYRHT